MYDAMASYVRECEWATVVAVAPVHSWSGCRLR